MANLFTRILNRTEERDIDASVFNLGLFNEGGKTASGKIVDQDTALSFAAVFSCVSLIADTIAGLTPHIYRKTANFREELTNLPKWADRINAMPNPETDSYTFFHRIVSSLCLDGNAYLMIQKRDNLGFPSEVWNLNPLDVEINREKGKAVYNWKGEKHERYTFDNPNGTILHIKLFEDGSEEGLSPIEAGAEAIGLGQALDEFGGKFFSNGTAPSAVLSYDGIPTDEDLKILRSTWDRRHKGSGNAQKLAIVTGGAKISMLSIPPEQAQFIAARKFQVSEIARIFRVPPHLIADVEKSTSWGTGIYEQNLAFYQLTLLPYLTRIEGALNMFLPRGNYIKFNVEGLLRGDQKSRYESYAIGRNNGFLSVNEIRNLEDLPAIDNEIGDVYIQQVNTVPLMKQDEQDNAVS